MILGIILVNAAVGALIGLTGVAGFLLPIYYMSVCKFNVIQGLVLSFSAFVGSSSIGTYYYYKTELIEMRFVKKWQLGILYLATIFHILGVIIGTIISQKINTMILKKIIIVM